MIEYYTKRFVDAIRPSELIELIKEFRKEEEKCGEFTNLLNIDENLLNNSKFVQFLVKELLNNRELKMKILQKAFEIDPISTLLHLARTFKAYTLDALDALLMFLKNKEKYIIKNVINELFTEFSEPLTLYLTDRLAKFEHYLPLPTYGFIDLNIKIVEKEKLSIETAGTI